MLPILLDRCPAVGTAVRVAASKRAWRTKHAPSGTRNADDGHPRYHWCISVRIRSVLHACCRGGRGSFRSSAPLDDRYRSPFEKVNERPGIFDRGRGSSDGPARRSGWRPRSSTPALEHVGGALSPPDRPRPEPGHPADRSSPCGCGWRRWGRKFGSATTTWWPRASRHRATHSLSVEGSRRIRAASVRR